MTTPTLSFDNTYARELEGFYVPVQPATVPAPALLYFNHALAHELGFDAASHDPASLAALFAGQRLPEGATPIAQAYAGHQFGHFSPQLGDGRALLIGEVMDRHGQRRDIAFKGSGRTPFSRNGDGKAGVGPMLREVIIGEAMHALGIPTTRALAVVGTGETVYRSPPQPGAVLTRVAASHLRVGTFQFFAAHTSAEQVRQLADYTIARHYPALLGTDAPYLGLLREVAERQAALVARWMHVGFIHGVMNTDNMSIPGETIDYGPCAFMETYRPRAVFSSIDEAGRYAYDRQPSIARWNLARLAETLLPLIDADEGRAIEQATAIIDAFPARYRQHWLSGLRAKLGLNPQAAKDEARDEADTALGEDWLALLKTHKVDFTLAWRWLADAAEGQEARLCALFAAVQDTAAQAALSDWLARWRAHCANGAGQDSITDAERAAAMRRVSPWLIARNHRVEEALAAASEDGDLAPCEKLLRALSRPYDEDPALAAYAEPAPAAFMAEFRTFCGT